VAVGAEEHVLGLEVAVRDPGGVELGERGHHLGDVEPDGRGREHAVGLRVAELVEVPAGAVGQRPRQQVGRLGAAEQGRKVRVREPGQHGHLPPRAPRRVGARGRPRRRRGALVEDLERVGLPAAGGAVHGEEDRAHGAAAQHARRAHVVQVDLHGWRHWHERERERAGCVAVSWRVAVVAKGGRGFGVPWRYMGGGRGGGVGAG